MAAAPYVPHQPDDKTPADLREAHNYYLTLRAQHPYAENKMLVRSVSRVLDFDAFHLADVFLTRPTPLIAGEKAGSLWHTENVDKKIGGATKKVVVPNAAHMDSYDNEKYANPAVKDISEFMKANLS
ncbi:hypothetical protein IFM51744_03016 [Aspergillus udagawae]|uniref:Uncharacterized protein n=1 Tax=Aspergillus udagawae TaxID=91492 RepID=A0A8E0QJ44_9EURO|nr:uncharacterized protein Aud_001271 [Aspergillus udagawae]GFF36111.1 hypothetical protein IFM51744_03016 [Aspergillus udagawae]GFF82069.1 hypothetical protein IFM53868_03351 [Aspergillus udagawae]GFG07207.1 hypothetical protein IFM5058_03306 [Aspergillus udagawae]GIC85440.1 hypothetical protein Aud_001271 [Aspergillus udagawae]